MIDLNGKTGLDKHVENKFRKGRAYFEDLYRNGDVPACSPGWVSGGCSGGHVFAKNVTCGREYCTDCGRDGSPIHSTRINRWTPKQRQMTEFGYMVVTIPEQLRPMFRYKAALNDFRRDFKNKLKKMGFTRGLMRWHYFGDCMECRGKGCKACRKTGAGRKFNPHLNIILEQFYMHTDIINELKHFLLRYFQRHYVKYLKRIKSSPLVPNIHYRYYKKESEQIHVIKYVTRSTFRIYDAKLAEQLKGMKTTTTFGKWDNENFLNEEKIDNNLCPKCDHHNPVQWERLLRPSEFNGKYQPLDNGTFYRISANPDATERQNKLGNAPPRLLTFRGGKRTSAKPGNKPPTNHRPDYFGISAPVAMAFTRRQNEILDRSNEPGPGWRN